MRAWDEAYQKMSIERQQLVISSHYGVASLHMFCNRSLVSPNYCAAPSPRPSQQKLARMFAHGYWAEDSATSHQEGWDQDRPPPPPLPGFCRSCARNLNFPDVYPVVGNDDCGTLWVCRGCWLLALAKQTWMTRNASELAERNFLEKMQEALNCISATRES